MSHDASRDDPYRRIVSIIVPIRWLVLGALLVGSIGCATTGPVTVRRDRFNFNAEGAESTKEQILLNIVRLRYGEPFYFVDIGSMLSHYTLAAGGNVGGWRNNIDVWENPALRAIYGIESDPNAQRSWEANLNFSDSPTITYTPLTGEEFAKRVMAPIPYTTIFYLAQSGWSVDRIFECCVQQINDLSNAPIHDVRAEAAVDTSGFQRLAELLKAIQDKGQLRFSVEMQASQEATYLYRPKTGIDKVREESEEINRLLGLPDSNESRIKVIESTAQREPNELAIQTRSLLATMYALALNIDVPDEHVNSREVSTRPSDVSSPSGPRWLNVHYGRLPRPDAFAQVFYNGYWFYIDKSDWTSKRTFAMVTYLLSLQATGKGAQTLPVVTVSAGGQ
jgi:hypothetical protein